MTPPATGILRPGAVGPMPPSILWPTPSSSRLCHGGPNGNGPLTLALCPPPSDQAPSIKTRYRSNAEAAFPTRNRQSPQSHRSKTIASDSRSPRLGLVNLTPERLTVNLPQGARAKARSSPPAPFTLLMEALAHREFHYLKPPENLSRQWGVPHYDRGNDSPGNTNARGLCFSFKKP